MSPSSVRCIALVPAAGSGSRLGAERPKQYIEIDGRPLLWHTLRALTQVARIDAVHVVLAPDDVWWSRFDWTDFGARVQTLRLGGATRADTVHNALQQLAPASDDWVLVHDAARVCITPNQVDALIDALQGDPVGGLLAVPLADTVKRAEAHAGAPRVTETVPRDGLWQAQTPQMFRYAVLQRALQHTCAVTDEAGAVEALGLQPRLVAADVTNFKVTYPQDVALAARILASRR